MFDDLNSFIRKRVTAKSNHLISLTLREKHSKPYNKIGRHLLIRIFESVCSISESVNRGLIVYTNVSGQQSSFVRDYCVMLFNPRIALGNKKKSPSSVFESVKKILFSIGRCPFVTFPEYEVGTKCNNQVANLCSRSCLAWRQTRVIFFWNWRNFMVMLTNENLYSPYNGSIRTEKRNLIKQSDYDNAVTEWQNNPI